MKKLTVIFMCAVLVLSFSGCKRFENNITERLDQIGKDMEEAENAAISGVDESVNNDFFNSDKTTEAPAGNEKKLINPFERIQIGFSGENGNGSATIRSINYDGADALETYFKITPNRNLKNGDVIIVTFDREKFLTYHSEYNVIETQAEYTVHSLTDKVLTSADPFDYVSISFSGSDGNGYARISSTSSVFTTDYFYIDGVNGTLYNGDIIIIRFYTDKFKSVSPYKNEYNIAKSYRAYTVTGLSTDNSLPYDLQVPGARNGYILPESNIRYYDEAFLSTFTDKQLKYARNEITARRGRRFNTKELQDYYETRSWYYPSYSPDYFDTYIFETMNEYEKGNMEIIKRIEKARKN